MSTVNNPYNRASVFQRRFLAFPYDQELALQNLYTIGGILDMELEYTRTLYCIGSNIKVKHSFANTTGHG